MGGKKNKYLSDARFVEILYKQLHNYKYRDSVITSNEQDKMSLEQIQILLALWAVQSLGENGELDLGLERMRKYFPLNLSFMGGSITGKGKPGNKLKESKQQKRIMCEKIIELMNTGMSQAKASKKIGMSAKNFRDYRDKFNLKEK